MEEKTAETAVLILSAIVAVELIILLGAAYYFILSMMGAFS